MGVVAVNRIKIGAGGWIFCHAPAFEAAPGGNGTSIVAARGHIFVGPTGGWGIRQAPHGDFIIDIDGPSKRTATNTAVAGGNHFIGLVGRNAAAPITPANHFIVGIDGAAFTSPYG